MYVEVFVAKNVWKVKVIRNQLEKDFENPVIKEVDGGVKICGENSLMTMSESKDWSFFYNVIDHKLDHLIYFECSENMDWMVTPIFRLMQFEKSRAFSGGQINDMIRWILSCLSGLKWEAKEKEEKQDES